MMFSVPIISFFFSEEGGFISLYPKAVRSYATGRRAALKRFTRRRPARRAKTTVRREPLREDERARARGCPRHVFFRVLKARTSWRCFAPGPVSTVTASLDEPTIENFSWSTLLSSIFSIWWKDVIWLYSPITNPSLLHFSRNRINAHHDNSDT
jgi:hypothetical protein